MSSSRARNILYRIFLASIFINVLAFAGSLYVILIYDSVIPSNSLPTLAYLFGFLCVLYIFQIIFENTRASLMLGLSSVVHRNLFYRVSHAASSHKLKGGNPNEAIQLNRDLDQVQSFLSGMGPIAIIDLPWIVPFLLALFLLHWALGLAALVGGIALAIVAWLTAHRSASKTDGVLKAAGRRFAAIQTEIRFVEDARALGMDERLLHRSETLDKAYIAAQNSLAGALSRLGGIGRVLRLFLQSLILTVGAVLVLDGQASGGIILGSSILAGRAFAPLDQAIANWRSLSAARQGWSRITEALAMYPLPAERLVELPPPHSELSVADLWVTPPRAGEFVLRNVNFQLNRGEALAIIGPSAAGKTSLLKVILGIWPAARGEVRLDGATPDQWSPSMAGGFMGYLPQSVELIEGTIGENIARFDPEATPDKIIAAARAAGFHETILSFPNGYEMPITAGGNELSTGQRQRIGLARALYGDPFLVVLDEPNSNLDAAGDGALAEAVQAVRNRGGIVIMVTHRPATLAPVSHVAVINAGQLTDFGLRDTVLERLAQGSQVPATDGGIRVKVPKA